MEKTLADIESNIAALRANVAKYRKLAEEHRAAANVMIAKKLMELVVELEARASELEELKARTAALAVFGGRGSSRGPSG